MISVDGLETFSNKYHSDPKERTGTDMQNLASQGLGLIYSSTRFPHRESLQTASLNPSCSTIHRAATGSFYTLPRQRKASRSCVRSLTCVSN